MSFKKRVLKARDLLVISSAVIATNLFFASIALSEESLQSAIQLYNLGKYTEALGAFESVQPSNADNPLYHYYVANTMLKMNLKKDAIREYKLARDLGRGNQIAKYSEAALRQLDSAPAVTGVAGNTAAGGSRSGGGSNPSTLASAAAQTATKTGWQEPLLVAFTGPKFDPKIEYRNSQGNAPRYNPRLDPRNDSQNDNFDLDTTLAKVFTRFGDRVEFKRVDILSPDSEILKMRDTYKVTGAPSVLLFDNQGKIFKRYSLQIDPNQLAQDVASIAGEKSQRHFANSHDERVSQFRFEQLNDVYSRIANADKELQSQLKAIDDDIASKTNDLAQSRTGRFRSIDTTNDAQQNLNTLTARKSQLQNNFQNQKKEWFAQADERIRAMESSR